ncbi:uncharacterized protein LOC105694313 [Orussus abietinus]|uniref:uncharacterized protein LOC105694313 n=1 Tax=Orussus abietinus TaxID=222816 RepID=UPI00062620C1|nr:uncharacterized protein LOC105694313 [Orussus abietinus]
MAFVGNRLRIISRFKHKHITSMYLPQEQQSNVEIRNNASKQLALTWKRPAGPLKVWRVIESKKFTQNGKPLKVSIQDIPKDRYDDVISHMSELYSKDETVAKSFNVIDAPVFLEDYCTVWRFGLEQDISVGAFVEDPKGGKPLIVGVNIQYVASEEDNEMKKKIPFKTKEIKNIFFSIERLKDNVNIKERYGTKTYLCGYGLSTVPDFRGDGIGKHLFTLRDDVALEYGVPASVAAFTGDISWRLAVSAGFDVLTDVKFCDLLDEDGQPIFPYLKKETIKIMGKKYR